MNINVDLDELAIENFRSYLKFPTISPNAHLDDCVEFIKKLASSLGLLVQVHEFVPQKPIVVASWIGLEPKLSSILLNGHMDVVPVYENKWTHDPFGAEIDQNGNIYGRGAQDMKCLNIQFLEAIRRLKLDGIRLKRSVHVCFMPDEETGGYDGMNLFVESDHFKDLNVGFAIDEGGATETEPFDLFYGEKTVWKAHFYCHGQSGHGSLLLPNTPGVKVNYLLNKLTELRSEQEKILEDNPSLTTSDVLSINLTILNGGIQDNVVPEEFDFVVDMRLPITLDVEEYTKMLNSWCAEAGKDVTVEFPIKNSPIEPTKLDDSNPFWVAFKNATNELNIEVKPRILYAGTDIRYLRKLGIPAIGFSPMNHTPTLAHDHDEYLNKDIFLRGIVIFMKVISAVANTTEKMNV